MPQWSSGVIFRIFKEEEGVNMQAVISSKKRADASMSSSSGRVARLGQVQIVRAVARRRPVRQDQSYCIYKGL